MVPYFAAFGIDFFSMKWLCIIATFHVDILIVSTWDIFLSLNNLCKFFSCVNITKLYTHTCMWKWLLYLVWARKKNSFIILLYIIFSYIERFFSSSLTILRYLLPSYEVHFFFWTDTKWSTYHRNTILLHKSQSVKVKSAGVASSSIG